MGSNRWFESEPNTTVAFHNDGTYDYFGRAPRGTTTAQPNWIIIRKAADGDWIIEYPSGSDQPSFIWDNVESYSYAILGTI